MQTCSTSMTVEVLTAVTVTSAVFDDVCCHMCSSYLYTSGSIIDGKILLL